MRHSPLRQSLVQALRNGPLNAIQATAAVGGTEVGVRKALDALCADGTIRRRGFSPWPYPKTLFELSQAQIEKRGEG